MNIAVDIETQGLDATKFIMGSTVRENGQSQTFTNKNDLWNNILTLGRAEHKRGKVLNVYAHNHIYDFLGYADLTDHNIKWYSEEPFIAAYAIEENGHKKEIIKFLDTYAIFKMSLKDLGKMLELPKLEMPKELEQLDQTDLTPLIPMIKEYNIRDAQICIEAIKYMRQKLKNEGVNIKRIYTISQIAIQYTLNQFKKIDDKLMNGFWYNKDKNAVWRTNYHLDIHAAYRGGRVECWKTGTTKNVTYIDVNSLYAEATLQMRFPKLSSERKTWNPLQWMKQDKLLNMIGISKALVLNQSDNLGLLLIRTKEFSYAPKAGKYLIGIWTNQELKKATENGYKILDIEWSITYDEAEFNPFSATTPLIYERRIQSGNDFDKYFYKMVLNASFGKFGQKRVSQDIVVDSIEEAEKYLARNYKMLHGHEYNVIYQNQNVERHFKKYYCPIIPALITAQARIIMYDYYKKIPQNDLVYTDTDSIIFTGDHLKRFPIGPGIGRFKIISENQNISVYGRKSYLIGEELKISGIRKTNANPDEIKRGVIRSRKMLTLKTAQTLEKAGTFVEDCRNLADQTENYLLTEEAMEKQIAYTDCDIICINRFIAYMNEKGIIPL